MCSFWVIYTFTFKIYIRKSIFFAGVGVIFYRVDTDFLPFFYRADTITLKPVKNRLHARAHTTYKRLHVRRGATIPA